MESDPRLFHYLKEVLLLNLTIFYYLCDTTTLANLSTKQDRTEYNIKT